MNRHHPGSELEDELLELEDRPPGADSALHLVLQGREKVYHGPPDVRSLLEALGENLSYANVRLNGTVLNRRDFENIPLQEGDRVDFLYFMGGGSCSISPMLKSSVTPGI